MLHIVDLDGAVGGSPANTETIRNIVKSLTIPCEIGGGIRTMETIEKYLEMGLQKVVLGTVAIKNPGLVKEAARSFPGRIVVGIDAVGGNVAVEGWTETTRESALELAQRFEGMGVAAINYTDISRDGAMVGPNIEATAEMVRAVKIPVIAAGGISKLDDIKALRKTGVAGAITGKALYEGAFSLIEAIKSVPFHIEIK
jgi:phosphoribosylformimino-5-aminoimidazole carboxamide ribotide isomerase